jgi:hypothetical protein
MLIPVRAPCNLTGATFMQPPATAATGTPRRTAAALLTAATLVLAVLLALLLVTAPAVRAQFWSSPRQPLPEFANQSPAVWVNSKPLSKAELAGKVVLIEIWTSV